MSQTEKKMGRVLVVDDDPRNIDIIVHLLEDVAEEIVTAPDAKHALHELETFDADLALLDIMMPGMNGYELCQLVKEKYSTIKVVLVSAKASVEERMKGYEVGADDYIPKPFDHDEFLAKARILLRLQSTENEIRSLNQSLETRVMERTQEVRNMYQQLLLASKLASLGEMSASIAHEINNPLTILKGNVDYLREVFQGKGNVDPKEMAAILDQQDTSIQRVVSIIQGLRRHARGEETEMVNFNVHKSVEETLSLFRPLLGSEQIQLEMNLSADSPFVHGLPTRFGQVLMNLLTNARDAVNGVPEAKIFVETRSVANKLELVVSDNGPGIPDELRNRIFDPFFTTKGVEHGTGLGLSIVGSIVSEMNGAISVQPREGGGTQFLISFPGLRSEDVLFDKMSDSPPPAAVQLKGKVLVVEDEEVIAHLVERYLTDLGLEVSVVLNGEEGLERIKKERFDLVMTDLQLPKLKGHELVSEGKRLGRLDSTRVVAVTGQVNPELRMSSALGKKGVKGFDGLLSKPFSKGDVYEIVRDLL